MDHICTATKQAQISQTAIECLVAVYDLCVLVLVFPSSIPRVLALVAASAVGVAAWGRGRNKPMMKA
ncbi:unnamed protein product [Arctogadus glacialis]